ncbi:hypothetical protein CONCODRAFT_79833 [Conidiobolus coronatus NRRL 28638]|uniref:Uncharacterized protein n=1 Tax=Conidiobolus coronatus (strain ATCC 28846 / CBS 209.66 / NRRL 28638) TaxID=796925 RepID=A0A137P069_CONC2|nr:hypothetical protein CONCODRAFT_79833 [Conidiobolus coronatus NRRL 28638]|eukprot:KXN68264.1 hypothetical protein CONCODRAFT_79833 [Conidiobolus coronatus NRRL 28638]
MAHKRHKSAPAEANEGSGFRSKSEENSHNRNHPRNQAISNSNQTTVSTIQINLISEDSMNSDEQENSYIQNNPNGKSINQNSIHVIEGSPNFNYKDNSCAQKILEDDVTIQNPEQTNANSTNISDRDTQNIKQTSVL